jgi:hypothetical protein
LFVLALFGYAIISDGLSVRLRVRSFTYLDQRQGHAASWSRQTYYAGLAPSGGLVFPDDVTIYPIEEESDDFFPFGRRRQRKRRIEWSDDQVLQSGYITARTQCQFLAVRSTASDARLVVSTGDAPSVDNQLGGAIEALLVRTADGKYHQTSNLDAGEEGSLESTTFAEAARRLQRRINVAKPREPRGFREGATPLRRNYYWKGMSEGEYEASLNTSILERSLGMFAPAAKLKDLPPRSYVAIVRDAPELPLGVKSPKQEDSLHVVFGVW